MVSYMSLMGKAIGSQDAHKTPVENTCLYLYVPTVDVPKARSMGLPFDPKVNLFYFTDPSLYVQVPQ